MLFTESRDCQQVMFPSSATFPVRILHVIEGKNRGGVETWLMRVLQHIDRERFHMDFLVTSIEPRAYDDEMRQLGSNIIPCLYPRRPWVYGPTFKRLLTQYGPYDVVHSHLHYFNGYVLYLAEQLGIPIRIAHSHIDTSAKEAQAGGLRRFYLDLMKFWIARCATAGLGCSGDAAIELFGTTWKDDPRWHILHYGLDLTPFQTSVDPTILRAELNIPADAFVLGHTGRFAEQKNHSFLIEIAAEVVKRHANTYLLLVGDGSLRPTIEEQVAATGLRDRVIFTGVRSDVARLMLGAMDVFVMPSLCEGLPIALIEAQAAGLPSVVSDVITNEVDIATSVIRRLSLSQPASAWADAILALRQKSAVQISATHAALETSPFNIACSVKTLEKLYVSR